MSLLPLAIIPFVLAIPNAFLLYYICKKLQAKTFRRIFSFAWVLYFLNALVIVLVFTVPELKSFKLDSIAVVALFLGYALAIFLIPFAVIFYFLARFIEKKLNSL